jgi:hypothetical protein
LSDITGFQGVIGPGLVVNVVQIVIEGDFHHGHDLRAGPGEVVPRLLESRRKSGLNLVNLAALLFPDLFQGKFFLR